MDAEVQREELQALAHERLGLIAELEAQVRDLERQVAQAQATTRNYRKRAQRARRQRDELRAQLDHAVADLVDLRARVGRLAIDTRRGWFYTGTDTAVTAAIVRRLSELLPETEPSR